jgi:hypothetical protein
MHPVRSGRERVGGGGDLGFAGGGELADDAHEVGVFEPRDQEGPPVGALLVGADVVPFVVGEGPPAGWLQGIDVQLDLLGEEPVDGAAQLEQLVDRLFSLVGGQFAGDLVDQQAVEAGVAGLVDPVEAQDVPEQLVELAAVPDVFDVVKLGERLDHAGQQQRGERRGGAPPSRQLHLTTASSVRGGRTP